MEPLTQSQVSAFRFRRHHLVDHHPVDLVTICRDTCGIQSQVMAAAELALWARDHGLTRANMQAALWEKRSLVKTALMRGTLHVISSADFPLYISALRASRIRETLRIMARYGVTEQEAQAVRDAVVETLAAGPLTRRELSERVLSLRILSDKARPWFEQSSWGVARLAIVEGFICYAPSQAQEVAFIRTDQWLPGGQEVPEGEARKTLLRRYLAAYGPATPLDFSRWTGLSMSEVQSAWRGLFEELVEVAVGKQRSAMLRKGYRTACDSDFDGAVVRLVPSFDPYLLGHAEKSQVVDRRWYKKVFRAQWWISPVLLLNGKAVGTWSYAGRGNRPSLDIKLFERIPKKIRTRLDEEIAGVQTFLGR